MHWSWLESLVYKLWERGVLKMGPNGPVLWCMFGVTLQQAQEYIRVRKQAQTEIEAAVRQRLVADSEPGTWGDPSDCRTAQLLRWYYQHGTHANPGGGRPKPDG